LPNEPNTKMLDKLFAAVVTKDPLMLVALINQNYKPNPKTLNKSFARAASWPDNIANIATLLKLGADPNTTASVTYLALDYSLNPSGIHTQVNCQATVLLNRAQDNDEEAIRLLIKYGADVTQRDCINRTIIEIASVYANEQLSESLIQLIASKSDKNIDTYKPKVADSLNGLIEKLEKHGHLISNQNGFKTYRISDYSFDVIIGDNAWGENKIVVNTKIYIDRENDSNIKRIFDFLPNIFYAPQKTTSMRLDSWLSKKLKPDLLQQDNIFLFPQGRIEMKLQVRRLDKQTELEFYLFVKK
jgi:hypothetical protein